MPSTCPSCGATHGCSCQMKIASDGKQVCSKCVNKYEQSIKLVAVKTSNAPKVVGVTYNGPGHQIK